MALLCFVLDLRTLPPPLLKQLKQCLLQLANLYSITPGKHEFRDRIGLCYIHRNRISLSDELKIVYSPSGNFSLRDFHHAVTNLPADAFLPEMMDPEAARIDGGDVPFVKLFSEEILYSWGGKDIVRKVIFLSSCLLENINSVRMILTDAADKCVSVEFILLEKDAQLPTDASRNVQEFVNSISDLENSSLRTYHPDTWMLYGLVKRWLQELKNNLEEPLQAVFLFKSGVTGSVDRIFCNLFASVDQIIDGFSPCKTCRCHGIPLDGSFGNRSKSSCSCPVTSHELRASDLIETSVKVGEHTILFLPSFQSFPEFQQVSAPINFNVIERTNLGSLSEGTIVGSSFVVTPSTSHEDEATSDETDTSELNNRVFQSLCQALHSLDQGLVCSSNCNMETMRMASFHCFYILQPSDKGPMLLRRLAGSEEILPFPDSIKTNDSGVPEEMASSVQTSLLKMDVRDYNPLVHERGFHQKLNFLVKESLQFGSVQPKQKEANTEHTSFFSPDPVPETKTQQPLTQAIVIDDSDDACLTEEWEQLIVEADSKMYSPKIRKTSVLQPLNGGNNNKQVMGEKTSRILERLEAPRQSRAKMCLPIVVNSAGTVSCTPKKKPLLPFGSVDVNPTLSQPMKPNFQRIKRRR